MGGALYTIRLECKNDKGEEYVTDHPIQGNGMMAQAIEKRIREHCEEFNLQKCNCKFSLIKTT